MFTGNCPSSVADHPQHHLTADGPAKPKVYRKMRGFVSAGLRLLRMLALRKLLLLQNLRYLSMVLGKKKSNKGVLWTSFKRPMAESSLYLSAEAKQSKCCIAFEVLMLQFLLYARCEELCIAAFCEVSG